MNKKTASPYLLLVLMIPLFNLGMAQNLLDMTHWVTGVGSTGIFNQNGSTNENTREWGIGPHGDRVVIWKASPEGNSDADGGWDSDMIFIDHQKKYRFTVWMKKTNSVSGSSYLGCQLVKNLDGSTNDNPYFWYGDLPELDKWYLLVGFVHGSGDESMLSEGGIYDGETGAKMVGIQDFKFVDTARYTIHRSYLFYDSNSADRQYFYGPRLEAVDGNELPLEVLLGSKKSATGETFFVDNVGIKTQNTRGDALAVNGHIRAKEIKVEAVNWPDYVFEEQYKLLDLREVEAFVKKNKHLPEVPSASEVSNQGAALGEMNKILLKKVEELTLHLIEKERKLSELENRVKVLEVTK